MFIIFFTSAVTAGPPVTTVTEVNVLTGTELVEQCKQPVAIATAVTMMVMMPVHMVGMFALFTKIEKMLNPHRLAAKIRQQKMAARRSTRQVW